MNHQDFALFVRNFLDAFARCHVKRLCSGPRFVFRNQLVHFVHVSGCRIVFEKRGITARGKRNNLGINIQSPVEWLSRKNLSEDLKMRMRNS